MSKIVELHADRTIRHHLDTNTMPFEPSPGGEVLRKRLHLYGPAESGEVTSIVKYPPGSQFPEHDHPKGEEIFVLDGIFSDRAGDWGVGSFLLNPEGFRHAPYSKDGCLIFVKLRQYPKSAHVAVNSETLNWIPINLGLDCKILYRDSATGESIYLARFHKGEDLHRVYPLGMEMLVLSACISDEYGSYEAGHWLRMPMKAEHTIKIQEGGLAYVREMRL